jgi:allophanate hydrolase subunit 1
MSEPTSQPPYRIPEEIQQKIQDTAQALHDQVTAINPNLVVKLTFGNRNVAPVFDLNPEITHAELDSFWNHWSGGGHFGDGFLKDGDGFANVSYVTAE